MNIEQLSRRLLTVSSYIVEGSVVADIGSDHAYLPCYVIKNGLAKFAIAGEVVEGPFQTAVHQVKAAGLEKLISVRKGNGLEVLKEGEADCITIAGMGGALITSILNQGEAKLRGVNRLILQPNIAASSIRRWCIKHQWRIVTEEILEEDKKIYEVLVLEPNMEYERYHLSDKEILMGPFLITEKNDVFIKKWQQEMDQWNRILQNLENAAITNETTEKKKQLEKNIMLVKEVLS